MNRKDEWTKILVARTVELVLLVASAGVGFWHSWKSKKLEEELDAEFEEEESDDET